MNVFDRIKIIEDYQLPNGIIIKKNSIGTLRSIYIDKEKGNDLYTIQIGINKMIADNTQRKKISTQITIGEFLIDEINEDELSSYLEEDKYNYEYITAKIFHIGNYWAIPIDNQYKTGIISNYQIKLNEKYDKITLNLLEEIWNHQQIDSNFQVKDYIYKKQYLENIGSYSTILD